jgi:hypothetical protein
MEILVSDKPNGTNAGLNFLTSVSAGTQTIIAGYYYLPAGKCLDLPLQMLYRTDNPSDALTTEYFNPRLRRLAVNQGSNNPNGDKQHFQNPVHHLPSLF